MAERHSQNDRAEATTVLLSDRAPAGDNNGGGGGGGFPTWAVGPIVGGVVVLAAALFVGSRYKRRRRPADSRAEQIKRVDSMISRFKTGSASDNLFTSRSGSTSGVADAKKATKAPMPQIREIIESEKKVGGVAEYGHNFDEKTFLKPTRCMVCLNVLLGLTKQGLGCSNCNAAVHPQCYQGVNFRCQPRTPSTPSRDNSFGGEIKDISAPVLVTRPAGYDSPMTPGAAAASSAGGGGGTTTPRGTPKSPVARKSDNFALPTDNEELDKMFLQLVRGLKLPPEREAPMMALPRAHKETLLRQHMKTMLKK